jgi:hypothetical protein
MAASCHVSELCLKLICDACSKQIYKECSEFDKLWIWWDSTWCSYLTLDLPVVPYLRPSERKADNARPKITEKHMGHFCMQDGSAFDVAAHLLAVCLSRVGSIFLNTRFNLCRRLRVKRELTQYSELTCSWRCTEDRKKTVTKHFCKLCSPDGNQTPWLFILPGNDTVTCGPVARRRLRNEQL